MTIQQAIQKAIEGEYPIEVRTGCSKDPKVEWQDVIFAHGVECKILLDPLFWQSLGKAMGWSEEGWEDPIGEGRPEWKIHWHRFIDHLAEGKSIESFFEPIN